MPGSYSDLAKIIEEEIKKNPFTGSPQNLYDPVNYIIGLGGKRIRPVLALMACELFSDHYEKAMPAAMALEVFHNFSLIHDDIMDKAPLRRGKPTVHEKWDMPTAILSGDLMLVKSYDILLRSEPKYWGDLMAVFVKAAAEVCEGQQMDMDFETLKTVSESDYLKMIRLKTSVLLGASLQMGAIIGGADKQAASNLYEFGVNMGMGFQLMDDYLDAFGTPELVGKQPGGDILAGKKTVMYIHSSSTESNALNAAISNSSLADNEKIERVKSIFIKTGADVYLQNLSLKYFNLASQNMESVNVETSKKAELKKLLVYLQTRKN